MPKFSNWDEGGTSAQNSSNSGERKSRFLKLQAGNKYRVRLIDKPLHYFQFWEPIIVRSPGTDENGNVVCPLMQMGEVPKDRYAIWVMDRNDDNYLKIMDFPPSLFNYFKTWHEATGQNPGGKQGCDWQITVKAPQGGQKKQYTKYEALALDRTPFSEEEIASMKEGVTIYRDDEERQVSLKDFLLDVRRDDTPEEIRKKLNEIGKSVGSKTTSAPAQSRVEKAEKAASTASSGSDDDFDGLDF